MEYLRKNSMFIFVRSFIKVNVTPAKVTGRYIGRCHTQESSKTSHKRHTKTYNMWFSPQGNWYKSLWIIIDATLVCRRFGCRRYGLSSFWLSGVVRDLLSPFWFVVVSACRRFDCTPKNFVFGTQCLWKIRTQTSLVRTPEREARWLIWVWPGQVQDWIMGAGGGVN